MRNLGSFKHGEGIWYEVENMELNPHFHVLGFCPTGHGFNGIVQLKVTQFSANDILLLLRWKEDAESRAVDPGTSKMSRGYLQ